MAMHSCITIEAFVVQVRRDSDASSWGFIELVASHTADSTSVASWATASEAEAFGRVGLFQPLGTALRMIRWPILCVIQIREVLHKSGHQKS